nr:hypothetical protein [candidate division Zixibacteria bacterium]
MMNTLAYLKSRRMWVVRDIMVWGLEADAEFHYLGIETVDTDSRLMLGILSVGDTAQDILYADLVDHHGNNLPAVINAPRVIIRPRSRHQAYLAGEESNAGFRIVRDPDAPGPIRVDFFIYETGL